MRIYLSSSTAEKPINTLPDVFVSIYRVVDTDSGQKRINENDRVVTSQRAAIKAAMKRALRYKKQQSILRAATRARNVFESKLASDVFVFRPRTGASVDAQVIKVLTP